MFSEPSSKGFVRSWEDKEALTEVCRMTWWKNPVFCGSEVLETAEVLRKVLVSLLPLPTEQTNIPWVGEQGKVFLSCGHK